MLYDCTGFTVTGVIELVLGVPILLLGWDDN